MGSWSYLSYEGVIEGDVRKDAGTKPVPGGVQVGSPETPFKINDIHSMHVVEVLIYTSSCINAYKSITLQPFRRWILFKAGRLFRLLRFF